MNSRKSANQLKRHKSQSGKFRLTSTTILAYITNRSLQRLGIELFSGTCLITMLNLVCYVRGYPSNSTFTVDIDEDEDVSSLRKAIKQQLRFKKIDVVFAHDLVLWKNSVPLDLDLHRSVEELNLDNDSALEEYEILSDVFPVMEENKEKKKKIVHIQVHIIIRFNRPHSGEF